MNDQDFKDLYLMSEQEKQDMIKRLSQDIELQDDETFNPEQEVI